MARRTKFTREVVEKLLRGIRMGGTVESACRYAGVSYPTFREWCNGKFPRGLDEDQKQLKAEFPEALMRAEGDSSMRALSTINQAFSQGDWKAAAWMLERRWPEEYGVKRMELTGKAGGPVQINHVQQKIQQLAAQVAAEEGIEEYGDDLVKSVMAKIKAEEEEDAKS